MRRIYAARLALLAPLVAAAALQVAEPPWLSGTAYRWALLALAVVLVAHVTRREQRLRGSLRAASHMLCRDCLYDLSAQGAPERTCPECGRAYNRATLRREWSETFLLAWPPTESPRRTTETPSSRGG